MNTETTTTTPTVTELERDVEARSAVFKKELGLFDLVLTQVVFVVGTFWVGWAARLGSQQSAFWILYPHVLRPTRHRGDLSQSPDAVRGRAVSMVQAGIQRFRRVHGRLEPLGVCDHDPGRHRIGSNHKLFLRHWPTRRLD